MSYIRFESKEQALKHRGGGAGRIAIDLAGIYHFFSADFTLDEVLLDVRLQANGRCCPKLI